MSASALRPGEVPIDVDLVRRLLAAQFPEWADLPLRAVPAFGTDNATYRLGADLAVRLPRFARWAEQVERERRWLPVLAPHLPLAVPVQVALGEPGAGYPFRWSVNRWLPGENPRIEAMADPRATARALAGFVTALRAVDGTGGPEPRLSNAYRGVPLDDPRESAAVAYRVREKIRRLAGLADVDALTALYERALGAPAWAGPPAWIHGDLTAGNLLATRGRLTAVIDFGCLAVGDPACDLAVAWTFLSAGNRDTFRAAVGADDASWLRGIGWGLATALPSPEDLAADDPLRAGRARRLLAEFLAEARR